MTRLTELPQELLDQITSNISTARDLSHFGQANKSLHKYIAEEGWGIFARTRFPHQIPTQDITVWQPIARSLTTLSRAWDRRAYVASILEPSGTITAYPSGNKTTEWRRPSAQTMGFAPQIDACEIEETESSIATDVLAFSAGAQVCLRKRSRKLAMGRKTEEKTTWSTYCPLSAREGADDVTALKLIRSRHALRQGKQEMISGTANGDLHHLSVPFESGEREVLTRYVTQGQAVQGLSLFEDEEQALFSTVLGSSNVALYSVDTSTPKRVPLSLTNFKTVAESQKPVSAFSSRSCRAWTTALLSKQHLAVGVGPSSTPLLLYEVRPDGIDATLSRSTNFVDDEGKQLQSTSVYAITPVPYNKHTFLSGAYDGVVRLHDLRTPLAAQRHYTSHYNDAQIYSLLTKGEHTLLAATGRNDKILVFDMRMEIRNYRYSTPLDAISEEWLDKESYGLYFRSSRPDRRRYMEGSVYALATSSQSSPFVHVGLRNTIVEMAVTEVAHQQPDPLHFAPGTTRSLKHRQRGNGPVRRKGWKDQHVMNLAKDEAGKFMTQAQISDMNSLQQPVGDRRHEVLDHRWQTSADLP